MRHTRSFSGDPGSVAAARRFATGAVSGVAADAAEAIELMVSELATNCIRHTQTGFELTITRMARGVRVEVTDGAGGTPRMRYPAADEPTGRGLQIVDLLAEAWGVESAAGAGKTVWFTVVIPPAPTAAGEQREQRTPCGCA